jgi:hypothetical protein
MHVGLTMAHAHSATNYLSTPSLGSRAWAEVGLRKCLECSNSDRVL